MRKADRAIEDEAERLEALLSCDWLTLSLADEDGAPYCVPLNFGAEKTREGVALYFHCARERSEEHTSELQFTRLGPSRMPSSA